MGTRSAAFTAKIKNLNDYQMRLVQSTVPLPSGTDIANTFKYFTTTLLGVLKDVPGQPMIMMKNRENDTERMALFPNLDYKGLHTSLIQMLDLFPLLPSGLYDFGKGFLSCLCSLIPFLERELIDTLPYIVASTLTVFPASLMEDVIDVLCWNLLPFTVSSEKPSDNFVLPKDGEPVERENYASNSAAAIMMMVFQFVKDDTTIHRKITECFMALKEDLVKDLLCVIAHGTPSSRIPAANLLFYYWPSLNPTHYDRRNALGKFNTGETWTPPPCCYKDCPGMVGKGNNGNNPNHHHLQHPNDAVKVCLDHSVSLFLFPDRPPISYFCHECFVTVSKKLLSKSELNAISTLFVDINHPIKQIDITCENKNCRAQEKIAVSTCFSPECSSYNGNKPIRYCNQCHKIRHNTRRGADHVIHVPLTSPWELEPETQNYLVKAIISLLKEARPFGSGKRTDKEESMQRTMAVLDVEDDENDEAFINERRLLSRYGVWLLVGLITLEQDTPHEIIGHMLSMLFEWFNTTAYLPNDKTGTALEKLKSEYLPTWIQKAYRSHPDVFMACLLPNPPDYAKVGGHWDVLTTRMTHIKEGLIRLFCLVPYDVITLDVWNKVMPHWMEAIHIVVPKDDLYELKRVFCKIFDPDMSPLGFDAREMYQFISIRFKSTPQIQRQALQWLQKLCLLHISIPLNILFEMFNLGVETMSKDHEEGSLPITKDKKNEALQINFEWEADDYPGLPSIHPDNDTGYPKDEPSATIFNGEKKMTCYNLMVDVLNSQMELQDVEKYVGLLGAHASEVLGLINKMLSAEWFGLITQVLSDEEISEEDEEAIHGIEDLMADFLQLTHTAIKNVVNSDPSGDSDDDTQETVQSVCSDPKDSKEKLLKKGPGLGGLMAALTTMQSTVEKTKDNLEESPSETSSEDEKEYSPEIEELEIPVKLLYNLLIHNVELKEPDMRFYLLDSVRLLTLHADVLTNIARKRKRFIRWCQESLLVGILWKILDSSQSQVAQVSVPILLHAITLPGGSDVFWKSVDDDFQDDDWRVRFAAVEKTTVIFRFLEPKAIRKSQNLRSSLSHAFCCLIACMSDINPEVSLRASLFLGTIHDTAVNALISCLENQFDNVPIDRPVILRRLYQLFNCLIDRKVLTWQFFASRFENLILELQNTNEKLPPDSAYQTMVRCNDSSQKRTKEGNASATVHSLSAALKYPYKRTISAPAGMGLSTKAGSYHKTQTENTQLSTGQTTPAGGYYRQQSVPLLKRKASKQGQDSVHQLNKQISNVGTVVDELEYVNVAAKTVDLDEIDKETLHLTVFLFMQFLSHPEQATLASSDEKQTSKTSPSAKAIQSLYSLLGFNENERRFTTMPHKIRSTPAVNAFLSNLPQVLDNNFKIGETLLPNIILVLQKLPFPQLCASSWQTGYTLMQESHLFQGCGYSLWHLEPSARKSWLSAVLVMVYKYNYPPEEVVGERLTGLIRIIIHTLAAHAHVCYRFSKPVLGLSARSRDLSQISLGQADNDNDTVFDGESNLQDDEDNDKVENGTQEEISTNLIVVKEEDSTESTSNVKKSEENDVMTNLFELLPRPSGNSSNPVAPSPYAPTPEHHQMTSEGLPEGWAMQLMHSGRTLFIDNANQTTTWIDPRTGRPAPIKNIVGNVKSRLGGVIESPPSPLSLMDVITVGNPIAVDRPSTSSSCGSNCETGILTSPPPLPSEERLLPIGISRKSSKKNYKNHQNHSLNIIDRVWQVLGSLDTTECSGESIPLIEPKSGEKIQLVASVSRNEDDSLRQGEITEKYTGTVTHINKAKLDALLKTTVANNNNNYTSNGIESPPTTPTKTVLYNSHNCIKKNIDTVTPRVNPTVSSLIPEKPCKTVNSIEKSIKNDKQRRRKFNSANHQDQIGSTMENNSKTSSLCGKKVKAAKTDSVGSLSSTRDNPLLLKHSALRVGEDAVVDRCSQCGQIKEEYSDEEIGLCIIILNTFINREPGLAAPLLPEILLTVTRIAQKSRYSWEFCDAPSVYVPSNCRSIARQFIRCVFHQLAPNGIFSLLFQMELSNKQREKFFETIVSALLDFSEVNPSVPVLLFLQEMNERKTWTSDLLEVSLLNLSCYLKFVPYETPNIWTFVFPQAETFLRRLWTLSANPTKSGSSSSAYKYGFHGGASNSHAATNCLQTGGGKSNEKIRKEYRGDRGSPAN
nr:protein unc-79 homolog [Lepeophtheirus salmonis]